MMNNGEAHVVSTIIQNVITSADKAYIAALYLNTKDSVSIRNTQEEMAHPQPEAPHTYQQLKIISNNQHRYCPKTLQRHRHAFLLAAWPWEPKIISSLLSAWIAKYRWLSHKTPPGGASSCCARYLLTQKNSQSGGHLLLTNKTNQGQPMMNNVEAHVVSTTIRNIITSAAEAKIAALYLNTK